MKLKIHLSKDPSRKEPVNCLDWANSNEILSCDENGIVLKWNNDTRESIEIAKLPNDFKATDLHVLPSRSSTSNSSSTGGGAKGSGDLILISGCDGRFLILNRSSRIEKNVLAHSGSICSGRWSNDGSSFLTASEDGVIKIWSRSGMLRSTVVQLETPIRIARWAPNSNSILFAIENYIAIKPNTGQLMKWIGHDGIVLSLAWSQNSELIATGGEDCRYKIWDQTGSILFNSPIDEYPINSIDFSPDSSLIAVGSFNLIKLCSSSGWSYSTTHFNLENVGSFLSVNWSSDGTQLIAGCGNGSIAFGAIVDQQVIFRNLRATLTGRKTIILEDIVTKTKDTLDFSERVIKMCIGNGHLVVATSKQIQIFNENYINTPIYVDGRIDVRIIELGQKNFLVVDNIGIWIYSYSGRLHLNPRFPGSQVQIHYISPKDISLGLNIVAIRDGANQSQIYLFDHLPGASRQDEPYSLQTRTPISAIALNRASTPDSQYLAVVDVNRDLFISSVRNPNEFSFFKIGSQLNHIIWGSDTNILAGLHEDSYSVYYCPGEACFDQNLIALTTTIHETAEFGKNVTLQAFNGSCLIFQSGNATFTVSVKIYCDLLHKFAQESQWNQCLKICRMVQNLILWGILAAIASKRNQLALSEEAFAAIPQVDKVNFLQKMASVTNSGGILNGRINEAETLLINNKKYEEAIRLQCSVFNWNRALKLAENKKEYMDLVESARKKYYATLGGQEENQKIK